MASWKEVLCSFLKSAAGGDVEERNKTEMCQENKPNVKNNNDDNNDNNNDNNDFPNLFITGPTGSGKSTLGNKLVEALVPNYNFLDLGKLCCTSYEPTTKKLGTAHVSNDSFEKKGQETVQHFCDIEKKLIQFATTVSVFSCSTKEYKMLFSDNADMILAGNTRLQEILCDILEEFHNVIFLAISSDSMYSVLGARLSSKVGCVVLKNKIECCPKQIITEPNIEGDLNMIELHEEHISSEIDKFFHYLVNLALTKKIHWDLFLEHSKELNVLRNNSIIMMDSEASRLAFKLFRNCIMKKVLRMSSI